MTGRSQFVSDMKLELVELQKLGVLTKAQLARAVAYVDQNAAEFSDPNMYVDVTGAVDSVIEIVGSCGTGGCE